jgi:hypothetical protein
MSNAVGAYVGPPTAGAPDLGDSRTTAEIAWTRGILTWADMPADAQSANAGGQVVAEGVVAVAGARRIGGVTHQVRLGWRAWGDLIVVVTVTRPLSRRQDGKFAPAGPWTASSTDEDEAAAPARHTRSTVPTGSPSQTSGSGDGSDVARREFDEAVEVFAYLPSPVRGALIKAVPTPDVWLAELSQFTTSGVTAVEQRLTMLRLDANAAVVLTATRSEVEARLAGTDWTVNRHTYTFTPVRPALGRGGPGTSRQIGHRP